MMNTFLTLLLSLHLATGLPPAAPLQELPLTPSSHLRPQQVWWGLIDPELSLWFARIPEDREDETILWDWSWKSIFSALFPQQLIKEADHGSVV